MRFTHSTTKKSANQLANEKLPRMNSGALVRYEDKMEIPQMIKDVYIYIYFFSDLESAIISIIQNHSKTQHTLYRPSVSQNGNISQQSMSILSIFTTNTCQIAEGRTVEVEAGMCGGRVEEEQESHRTD